VVWGALSALESIAIGLYPNIAYRIWRDIALLPWGQIVRDLCVASLSVYWTRTCIDDSNARLNSRWQKYRLRTVNAIYVAFSGSELNVERSQNQAIDENKLLGEYCRIEICKYQSALNSDSAQARN
jgi:hypothetical protein